MTRQQMFRLVLIPLFSLLFVQEILAGKGGKQEDSKQESYYVTLATQAIASSDFSTAYGYLNEALAENPKDPHAYVYMTIVMNSTNEYDKVDSYALQGLKYLGKDEKEYRDQCYISMYYAALARRDTVKALSRLQEGLKSKPGSPEQFYGLRGQLLMSMDKYKEAKVDFEKAISLSSEDIGAYLGLGACEYELGNYEAALEVANKALQSNYNEAALYMIRVQSLIKLNRKEETINDLMSILYLKNDLSWFQGLYGMIKSDVSYQKMVPSLKIFSNRFPNEYIWPYALGCVYNCHQEKNKALEHYLQAYKIAVNTALLKITLERYLQAYKIAVGNNDIANSIAHFALMNEDFDEAKNYLEMSLAIDSTDEMSRYMYIGTLIQERSLDKAKSLIEKELKKNSKNASMYDIRGFLKWSMRDFKGAKEDYLKAAEYDSTGKKYYFYIAENARREGDNETASIYFKHLIEDKNLDENDTSRIYFAYLYFNEEAKAIASLNRYMRETPENTCDMFYELACFYSIKGDKKLALEYLEKSFEAGNRSMNHISFDSDMDLIRDTPEFKALFAKYRDLGEAERKERKSIYELGFAKVDDGIISRQDKTYVMYFVDEDAEFPGGLDALLEFIYKNFKMPEDVEKNISSKEEVQTIVSFNVEKDGSISNIKIDESYSPTVDAEVIRVMNMMPKWVPAKYKGKNTTSRYKLPFNLK